MVKSLQAGVHRQDFNNRPCVKMFNTEPLYFMVPVPIDISLGIFHEPCPLNKSCQLSRFAGIHIVWIIEFHSVVAMAEQHFFT